MSPLLKRRDVIGQAWPILLSQATLPLVGIVDTAIIGRFSTPQQLAGVALGAAIVNFMFWSFGFLRMGMTGLTAQSVGQENTLETHALLLRSILLGLGLGGCLFIFQPFLIWGAYNLVSIDPSTEATASQYTSARFWGAPALLAGYAINGWLLGLGKARHALLLQIITNAANIVFDLYLVAEMDLGAQGVGYGTAGAEWISFIAGIFICVHVLKQFSISSRLTLAQLSDLWIPERIIAMLTVNTNIMIRTIALLTLMTWFTNASGQYGSNQLAANHILMQMLSVSAYILDAFAMTAEARVGAAIGAGSRSRFWRAVKLTTEFALLGAFICAVAIYSFGAIYIDLVVLDEDVRMLAQTFLPIVAVTPLLGVASWQLDGIFVGATMASAMRTSTLITLGLYVLLDRLLIPLGNWGVWIAFSSTYVLRGITLGLFFPQILRKLGQHAPIFNKAS